MRQAHGDHANPPQNHDGGNEHRGTQPFQQDVSKRLEERVGDEEDRQTGVVLAICDFEGFLQALESRVADVGTVEERDEVE